jgi:DNA-binding MurR/RpiR family transcriptional regulator
VTDESGLAHLIAAAADQLTITERRIARVVLDEPTAAAFGTVADLARQAGTSAPSVVRFAAKLGLGGFGGLQDQARRSLTSQLRRPTDRLRQAAPDDPWEQARQVAIASVTAVFERVPHDRLTALARPVATAPGRVWITASETSSSSAHLLATNLALLRPGVHHLTGPRAAVVAALTDAGPDDVAVAIDFPRYERSVLDTARWLVDEGVTLMAITDGPLSPLAGLARQWCAIDVGAIGPFDSTLPTVALVEAVAAEVAGQLRQAATTRLERAEALWSLHDVFADDEAPR